MFRYLSIGCLFFLACHGEEPQTPRASVKVATDLAQSASPSAVRTYAVHGRLVALQLQDSQLTFCDAAGVFTLNLPPEGSLRAVPSPCARRKPQGACPETSPVIDTRHPYNGTQDIIDTANNVFPLVGNVHDCALDGSVIAVSTSVGVRVLDDASGRSVTLSTSNSDYVALSRQWVAWNDASGIHLMSRAAIR